MSSKNEDIHIAARNGDVNCVELIIISNPLALNSRDKHSRTPLHLAAWAGHANVVSALCRHKADVGAAAMDDMGAIHFAAQKGHVEVVKTLVSEGASVKGVNRKGMTALHYAVQGPHVELTKYLLKKGFNLNAKTKAGKTVLDLAKNDEIRSLLLEHEKAKQTKAQDESEEVAEQDKNQESDSPLDGKAKENEAQEDNEENLKRKGDSDVQVRSLPKPKKTKVALGHLLASDDAQDDD
ncbi:hypothetical protein RND81_08G150900 [Saponaria officinalis]|uniref:Uncharacterized protein n=1 Tax=Saponaria officinalis TaxID=3572 RepID=A0AAW1J7J9_SAPOF